MTGKRKKSKPLIVLAGPTASGKTDVALLLARKIKAEIISADSRQVYKGMNIGTAKPPVEWKITAGRRRLLLNDIVHHMIDIIRPDEEFNVGRYKQRVDRIIADIYKRGNIPLIVGGTGLYIKAVVDGLCPAPPVDEKVRERLRALGRRYGSMYLYRRLTKVDPVSAERIHPKNLVRILRALEVYKVSKVPLSEYQKKTPKPEYNVKMFGLLWDREELYDRINKRVAKMFSDGLIDEVQGLLKKGYGRELNSMQSLGYKQIIGYLKGEYDLKEAERLLKRDTTRYAKRQMTWFRKDKRICWIKIKSMLDAEKIADKIKNIVIRVNQTAGI